MLQFVEILLITILILTPFTENVCDLDLEHSTPTTFLYEFNCIVESSSFLGCYFIIKLSQLKLSKNNTMLL